MKITVVVVTCNRLALLPRALQSIKEQSRKADYVYVVSNSSDNNYQKEQEICSSFGFNLFKNYRTQNYAGALNSGIEEIVINQGISDDNYFASLDDDDIWLPGYLKEIETSNNEDFDLIAATYLRSSNNESLLMTLPDKLSESDFLIGNPGIGGSNTFIRLKTILQSGCFDEALHSSVDRDFFVRVFQQKPRYKIINKHLVTAYTDIDRDRLTTNRFKKISSYQVFYYKYQHLMKDADKQNFFVRANNYFGIERHEIDIPYLKESPIRKTDLEFKSKGKYQFIIGFIAGNSNIAKRIVLQIIEKNIPVDLVLIIEDVPVEEKLEGCEQLFNEYSIPYKIIKDNEWKRNLSSGYYGSYFQQHTTINSIPLGRTILHHHLFVETKNFKHPVFWIIDDDITFRSVISPALKDDNVDVFEVINENLGKAGALIGGISNDPPVPMLSCLRLQLLDFYHSIGANGEKQQDGYALREKPEYYYDLSDIHTDHLEVPIYHSNITDQNLNQIFSGKSLSRPSLQKEVKTVNEIVTRRGANTLVLDRELLQYYPVINLKVNNIHSRRGDLIWALLNQMVSGRTIIQHTFSIEHNRPVTDFDLKKEINKAAYDIIGYAFSKSMLKTIQEIINKTGPYRPKDVFEKLLMDDFYLQFFSSYSYFLNRRKAKFLINFHRITGLTMLIAQQQETARGFYNQMTDKNKIHQLDAILHEASQEITLKSFLKEMTTAIWSYSNSILKITENDDVYKGFLEQYFNLSKPLLKLGGGAEGVVFTDNRYVYKCFFNILDNEWNFLHSKIDCFIKSELLEKIECYESNHFRFIRYPYYSFRTIEKISVLEITSFLKFCEANDFVYTNIKPINFIQKKSGKVKLIDYGKSFEPFNQDKFINMIKRFFLLWRFPVMLNEDFQKLTSIINRGEDPKEIDGWENLWRAVQPRKKEEILDTLIISLINELNPGKILDYGSGKCKTAKQLKLVSKASVFVYDISDVILKSRCGGFERYSPSDRNFNNTFDVVLLNLVLCEVNDGIVKEILSNVIRVLIADGTAVISICNPDFANICKSEFHNRNFPAYSTTKEEIVIKTCKYTGNRKIEYHRPTETYRQIFKDAGFRIVKEIDTKGVNIETLDTASDFKVFVLKK